MNRASFFSSPLEEAPPSANSSWSAAQSCPRRMVAAHAMDAATGRCGGGTNVETADRGRVRDEPGCGPGEELAEVARAAGDVPAHEIRIMLFKAGGGHDTAREHAVVEAGR